MSKLMMLAGGMVGDKRGGTVSAYVVLSAGAQSRVFKLAGNATAPTVTELPAATTLDIKRFQRELDNDLPDDKTMTTPDSGWICGLVRAHLKATEGLDVP